MSMPSVYCSLSFGEVWFPLTAVLPGPMANFQAKSGQKNRARGEIQLPKSTKINKSKRNPKGASILEKNRCPVAGYKHWEKVSSEHFRIETESNWITPTFHKDRSKTKIVQNVLQSKQNEPATLNSNPANSKLLPATLKLLASHLCIPYNIQLAVLNL